MYDKLLELDASLNDNHEAAGIFEMFYHS